MALKDTWHRALVYFGLAEDDRYVDEEPLDDIEPEAELEERYRTREQVPVGRIAFERRTSLFPQLCPQRRVTVEAGFTDRRHSL